MDGSHPHQTPTQTVTDLKNGQGGSAVNDSHSFFLIKYLTIFLRFSFVLAIIIVFTALSYYVLKYAYPFVIALILAILIQPFVAWLERHLRMPRAFATLIVMMAGLALMVGTISLISVEMISGLSYLIDRLPVAMQSAITLLNGFITHHFFPIREKMIDFFYTMNDSQKAALLHHIENVNHEMMALITTTGTNVLRQLMDMMLHLPNAIALLIIIFMATFFICKDWHRFSNYLHRRLAKSIHSTLLQVFNDFKEAVLGYMRAQLALMSVTCAVLMICLSILRVPHAFTVSLLTAGVDFLPYIGTGAVLLPWATYAFLSGQAPLSFYLALIYLLLVAIRQLLEPKLLATSIGLNPLAALVSVFVGFQIFGWAGIMIGPWLVVFLKSLSHANVFKTAWTFIVGSSGK